MYRVCQIPSFALSMVALADVNLSAPIEFEVVTSCPTAPPDCPAVDIACGDTVFTTLDLDEAVGLLIHTNLSLLLFFFFFFFLVDLFF